MQEARVTAPERIHRSKARGGSMLPDHMIYEELERQRQLESPQERRSYLEISGHIPYWPEPPEEGEEQDRDKNPIDVLIINM